jgi:Ca2+-binding EF-hand superfamily protein
VFDIDKTGMVTCENLHQVFASLGIKCSEDEIKQMIEGADLKKDGGVDFEGAIFLYVSVLTDMFFCVKN